MKRFLGIVVLGLLWCNTANANLFNLNTYASCKKTSGPNYSSVWELFGNISYDNNHLRFKYASYSKKFLIEERYSGTTILKAIIKDDGSVYKIEFNKETGELEARGTYDFSFRCYKIKKNKLP